MSGCHKAKKYESQWGNLLADAENAPSPENAGRDSQGEEALRCCWTTYTPTSYAGVNTVDLKRVRTGGSNVEVRNLLSDPTAKSS
jgi:hypothetical protein